MTTQDSDNRPTPILLQEIQILFSNYDSNPNYEVIDLDDINILSLNHTIEVPESRAYKIKKHGIDSSIIIDHYVKEIHGIINSGIVDNGKELKTFLASIICDSNEAEVKLIEIDEEVRELWKKDKIILSGFNQQSINFIKVLINHLCFIRDIACESEQYFEYLLGKYVEEGKKKERSEKVCFVKKEGKDSKRMDEKLMNEILRLELEELINRLKELGNKLDKLLINNEKLVNKNFWLKEKINYIYENELLLDYDGIVKHKERKKLKQILNELKKEFLNVRQNLKETETENLRLLDEVNSVSRQLDCERIKNVRFLNDLSLEMFYVRKLNRSGENKLAEAIDLGAELLEDISRIGDHLTKMRFTIQKIDTPKTSKDYYFAYCIEAGREFISKLFVQLRILMDTISNLENNLREVGLEVKERTGEVINLKKKKTELKEKIFCEKMALETIIKSPENCFTDGELLLKNSNKYSRRDNQVTTFYKTNYELSEKLLQAETCCNDLVLKLKYADNEKDSLKITIKKQEAMLRENQKIIDQLKGENVALKKRNDDLIGTLIASMVLLFCCKKIVSNWIKDNNKTKHKS